MTMTTTNTTSNLKGNKTMKLRNKIRLLENLTVAQNILSQVEQLQQINLVLAARGKD